MPHLRTCIELCIDCNKSPFS
ncbi:MAG: four-helix bundle copper-binding protein [Acholeplasmataceae bacterium]